MHRTLVATLISLLLLGGCASMRPSREDPIDHVVIVWLKEPGNDAQRQQMIDRSKTFTQIPGVQRVSVGTALPSTRPVVDSSYDVALVIRFANEQALRDYDQHPIHRKAVQELLAPLAARFVIYDFRVK
jgi:hypothetical protein